MDLTRDPIPGLIRRIAVPASLAFFFNTMFNVVDTFYAGRLATTSLAALSLSFPMFFILLSVGIGIQSGAGALMANALGAGQRQRAVALQLQAAVLAAIVTVALAIPLYLLLPAIFRFFGADGDVLAGGLRYMRPIVAGSILMVLTNTLNAGLQARGDTRTFRNLLIAISAANVALDPLFIFVFGLREGGIALATIVLYGVGVLYIVERGRRQGVYEGAGWRDLMPNPRLLREVAGQSGPASLNYMIMTLGSFVINFYISRFGTAPVAAYGAALRVEQIALLPLLGINIALATLTGQNNGAGRLDRVEEAFRITLRYALIVALCILPPVLLAARPILLLFTDSGEVVSIGRTYLLIQGVTFFSYIIINLSNSIVQGLKQPAMIMWVGLYRQVAAPLVVFPLLAFRLGMEERGVFWGLAVVNWSAALVSLAWARSRLGRAQVAATPTTAGVETAR